MQVNFSLGIEAICTLEFFQVFITERKHCDNEIYELLEISTYVGLRGPTALTETSPSSVKSKTGREDDTLFMHIFQLVHQKEASVAIFTNLMQYIL